MDSEFIKEQYGIALHNLNILAQNGFRISKSEQSAMLEVLKNYFFKAALLRVAACNANDNHGLKSKAKIEQIVTICITKEYIKARGYAGKLKRRKWNIMLNDKEASC